MKELNKQGESFPPAVSPTVFLAGLKQFVDFVRRCKDHRARSRERRAATPKPLATYNADDPQVPADLSPR